MDKLAATLCALVQVFRKGGKAQNFEWWQGKIGRNLFLPVYGYEAGQPLFEEVVAGILTLNPTMLSQYEVEVRTIFDFLQEQTVDLTKDSHLRGKSLHNEARNHVAKLVEFEAWQDVEIPIENLWLDGDSVKLGSVVFTAVTDEYLEKWKKNPALWPNKALNIHMLATVNSPGDQQLALSHAQDQVKFALSVLRAFCFPFGDGNASWRVGMVGDVLSAASTPMRIGGRIITKLGPGTSAIDLRKHVYDKLSLPQWNQLDGFAQGKAESGMATKLLSCIHWLAEATKPDTNNARFAKIGFALESLIGGEPNDDNLKVRGITAMLAERAAFIAGTCLEDRLAIDKETRQHYGKRSKIVHGDESDATLTDIDNFGELTRRIALAILKKLNEIGDEIRTVEKLETWVKKQKYLLPE